MKITKDTLRQLVKEELTELQEQTMSLPPGEEGGRQLEVPEPGQTKAPYGLGADGHLNLKTIAKMQDDMVKIAGKLKGFTNNYFKAIGGSEGQGDSNLRKLNVRARRVAAALEELDEDIEMNLVAQAARYELREESDTLEEMIREEIQAVLVEDMEKKTKISAWEDWCDGKSKTWPTVNGVELKVDSMPLSLRMTCKAKANRAWKKRTQSR